MALHLEFGGRISLSKSPQKISVDAFNPGNTFIGISNGVSSQLITVEVRAPRKIAAFPGAKEVDRLNGPVDFAIVLELT